MMGSNSRFVWAFAAFLPGIAHAAPGDHIRAGDVEVKPSITAGADYQTNVYRSEDESTPAGRFSATPAVVLAAEGDDHRLQASASWTLYKYAFVVDNGLPDVGPDNRVTSLDRYDQFQVGAAADLFTQGAVGLELSDSAQNTNVVVDTEVSDDPYYSQLRNTAHAGVRIAPGDTLTFVPAVDYSLVRYALPSDDQLDRRANLRNSIGPKLSARWLALPETALFAEASYTVTSWSENTVAGRSEGGRGLVVPNSSSASARVGVESRLTDRISVLGGIGYASFVTADGSVPATDDAQDATANASGAQGLLLNAAAHYLLSTDGDRPPQLGLSYERSLQASYFTSFSVVNTGRVDLTGQIGDVIPRLQYQVRSYGYHGQIERDDLVHAITAELGWAVAKYATIAGGVTHTKRLSSSDVFEFDNTLVYVNASFTY